MPTKFTPEQLEMMRETAPEMYKALADSQSLLAQLTAKWPNGQKNTLICRQIDRNSAVLIKARGEDV